MKQKRLGIILMISGMLAAVIIFSLLYGSALKKSDFADYAPADAILYAHFPTALPPFAEKVLDSVFDVAWATDIAPFTSGHAALFLLPEEQPVLAFKPEFPEPALLAIKNNPRTAKLFTQTHDKTVFVATSRETLEKINSSLKKHGLTQQENFKRVHAHSSGNFFVYLARDQAPTSLLAKIHSMVPRVPLTSLSPAIVGAWGEISPTQIQGTSHAIAQAKPREENTQRAYRALLLPFIPQGPELIFGGQNVAWQVGSITSVREAFAAYLPEVSLETDISPLMTKEFAAAVYGDSVVFISEAFNHETAGVDKILESLKKSGGRFIPAARDVILPDGTEAQELVPDSSQVQNFEEKFEGIDIKGVAFGRQKGFFTAIFGQKLIMSNDSLLLKKALLLTKAPGANFRESELYRDALQPIIKNPEVFAVIKSVDGTFSFSKRAFEDYTETNFRYSAQ